jgi:hypothetical protein
MNPEGSLPYLQEPATYPYCVYTNNIAFSSVYFSITFLYCHGLPNTIGVKVISESREQKCIETLSRSNVRILVLEYHS